jgi:hypothetical protein
MDFEKGETVNWIVSDKKNMILQRESAPPDPIRIKKNK